MMNTKIQEAVNTLIEIVREESTDENVAFELFFNSSEHEYKFRSRSAEGLKQDGISMRNLKGEFIK